MPGKLRSEPLSLYKQKYRITSIRLKWYDYASAGMYFITANAHRNQCIFGKIHDEVMHLSPIGEMLESCWNQIPEHFPHIELDASQIMPNHVHGILMFVQNGDGFGKLSDSGREKGALQKGSLSMVMNSFKGAVTRVMRQSGRTDPVWQPRFHEHIIRSERSLEQIREYIVMNPARWKEDRYYSQL